MRLRLLPVSLVLVALMLVSALPSYARDRDRGRRDGRIAFDRDRDCNDRFFDRRDRRFDRRSSIFFDDDFDRPRGWNRGRKVGWGNCDLPPGLAKKYGCRSTFFGRDRRVVRRPTVVIPLPIPRIY